MQYQKVNKNPLSYRIAPWLWLTGVDKIAKYLNCNIADIQDWIISYNFPAVKNVKNILIAKRAAAKKFLKKYNPSKTNIDDIPVIQKPKNIRQRRW